MNWRLRFLRTWFRNANQWYPKTSWLNAKAFRARDGSPPKYIFSEFLKSQAILIHKFAYPQNRRFLRKNNIYWRIVRWANCPLGELPFRQIIRGRIVQSHSWIPMQVALWWVTSIIMVWYRRTNQWVITCMCSGSVRHELTWCGVVMFMLLLAVTFRTSIRYCPVPTYPVGTVQNCAFHCLAVSKWLHSIPYFVQYDLWL